MGIVMPTKRYELRDIQWEQIKDLILRAKAGRPPKDDRMMLNAIFWLARSGVAWSDIPEQYGPHQTVYSRFCKWQDDGTLLRIFHALSKDVNYKTSVSTALPSQHIHTVRVQKGVANSEYNQFIGVSRCGKTTKFHAIVDAQGNPVHLIEFFSTGYKLLAASFFAFVLLATIWLLAK